MTEGRGSAPLAWRSNQPLFELGVKYPVGKAFSANPDPLKDAVAPQLVKDQEGIHHAWRSHKDADLQ